jgi:hypothetical protein
MPERAEMITKLSIRVGVFGDESMSMRILDAMRRSYDAA